jgi:hypothetical protein
MYTLATNLQIVNSRSPSCPTRDFGHSTVSTLLFHKLPPKFLFLLTRWSSIQLSAWDQRRTRARRHMRGGHEGVQEMESCTYISSNTWLVYCQLLGFGRNQLGRRACSARRAWWLSDYRGGTPAGPTRHWWVSWCWCTHQHLARPLVRMSPTWHSLST